MDIRDYTDYTDFKSFRDFRDFANFKEFNDYKEFCAFKAYKEKRGAPFALKLERAEGALDPTFGGGSGVVKLRDPRDGDNIDARIIEPLVIVTSNDQKIYIAGITNEQQKNSCFVFRLFEDGQLDRSFNPDFYGGGSLLIPLGDVSVIDKFEPRSVISLNQEAGTITFLGQATLGQSTPEQRRVPVLWRVTFDGKMDDTFGDGGVRIYTDLLEVGAVRGQRMDSSSRKRNQESGSILFLAPVRHAGILYSDVYLVKVEYDGSLDALFGGGMGYIKLANQESSLFGQSAYSVDDQKRIVILVRDPDNNRNVIVERYDQQGNIDQSFGETGKVVLTEPQPSLISYPVAVKTLNGGKILVLSGSFAAGNVAYGVVTQLVFFGALDPEFNEGRPVKINDNNLGEYIPRSLAVDDGGRIIVGSRGLIIYPGEAGYSGTLTRLTRLGAFDPSFGLEGTADYSGFDPETIEAQYEKILATGVIGFTTYGVGGIARVLGDLVPSHENPAL
ncbi:hypothetical protein [Pseudomonas sp. NA-150]|uniref:hypothetical protein n=1 Tax=Pseudomonas sp. NA-150 TaxID=3367525 RepID=UPI0037CB3F6A